MSDEIEWTYKNKGNLETHHVALVTNNTRTAYLSVSFYKERWHFYASAHEDHVYSTWCDPYAANGFDTLGQAQAAAITYGKNAIDPEHIEWYMIDNYGALYYEACFRPLDGIMDVFQILDEDNGDPVDDEWHWQFYMPPDFLVSSADKDDNAYTDGGKAQEAVIEYAQELRVVIEKEKENRKQAERTRAQALKNREAANVDVKYVEGKPTLFD